MSSFESTFSLYKVSDFIAWKKSKNLVLAPYFQRRSVWKKGAKSFFLDSVVKGFPIPSIFIRDKQEDLSSLEPLREVVDGQQRLRTLISFIAPDLLSDFNVERDNFTIQRSHNQDLAGKSFQELPLQIRQKILSYRFTVHVLPTWIDDREILEIFRRMNSTNYSLNPQELRNAKFFGEFKTLAYRLATQQLHRWREWGTFTEEDIARMLEVELTSELIILMLSKKLGGKSNKQIDNFYADYDDSLPEFEVIEDRFNVVMDFIKDYVERDILIAVFARKALFYSLFAFVYDNLFGLKSNVVMRKEKKVSRKVVEWINLAGKEIETRTAPDEVLSASDRRTTNPKERNLIFNYLSRQ